MSASDDVCAGSVSLTSRWFIRPGCEAQAIAAVDEVAAKVLAGEPGTLIYLAHTANTGNDGLQSLPPSQPELLLFFEMYRDPQAFLQHVNGPIFTAFVRDHGHLFVPNGQGAPYTTVEFLARRAGFVRALAATQSADSMVTPTNRSPAVMFEFISKCPSRAQAFYSTVFGWHYDSGTGGFAYVRFPVQVQPLLGGIGQASTEPGFEPGHNFYLQVENLETTITAAEAAGGALHMPITSVDGYRFAMVKDPDGNPIGLIEPFAG
jgi:predicted enzyme related to lactoylglutathione lyase/quinol monooxygenase YgiN